MGSRLASLKKDDPSSWGYFKIAGSSVACRLPDSAGQIQSCNIPALAASTDWKLEQNWAPDAVLTSASQAASVKVMGAFSAAGISLQDIVFPLVLELPLAEVPAVVAATPRKVAEVALEAASPLAKAKALAAAALGPPASAASATSSEAPTPGAGSVRPRLPGTGTA